MAKADYEALFDTIDTETTRIAGEFEEILAKLAAGGMTAEEEAALLARGQSAADRLKGIKKDNPTGEPGGGTGEGEGTGGTGGGEPGTGGEGERG